MHIYIHTYVHITYVCMCVIMYVCMHVWFDMIDLICYASLCSIWHYFDFLDEFDLFCLTWSVNYHSLFVMIYFICCALFF